MSHQYDVITQGDAKHLSDFLKLDISDTDTYKEVLSKMNSEGIVNYRLMITSDEFVKDNHENLNICISKIKGVLKNPKLVLRVIEQAVLEGKLNWIEIDQLIIYCLVELYDFNMNELLDKLYEEVESDIYSVSVMMRSVILSHLIFFNRSNPRSIDHQREFNRNGLVKLLSLLLSEDQIQDYNDYLKLKSSKLKIN